MAGRGARPRQARIASPIGDALHIVHVCVIDPHPQRPGPGPYSGVVSEAQYSTKRQPLTYADRLAAARDMRPFVTGPQRIIVDGLAPGATNPMWCTYGTCPNCAFLIRQDGTIDTVQTWFERASMEAAIRAIAAKQRGASRTTVRGPGWHL